LNEVDLRRFLAVDVAAEAGIAWPPVMPTARLSSSSTVTLPPL
jgi:hypothetical protein